jgi:hypothetical protein
MVYGHKIKYEDTNHNFSTEISIYNEKTKELVLEEHLSKIVLPFYISISLIILKTFYYKLNILPDNIYYFFKKIIMNYLVEGVDVEFITTDMPTK